MTDLSKFNALSTSATKKSRGVQISNDAANAPAFKPLAAARKRLRSGLSTRSRRDQKVNPKSAEAGKAALERTRPVTISLRNALRITSAPETRVTQRADGKLVYTDVPGTGGEKVYGPGSVTVPRAVASVLLEMDRNASDVRAAETTERAGIIIGGPGGLRRTLDVPPESFEAFMGRDQILSSFR